MRSFSWQRTAVGCCILPAEAVWCNFPIRTCWCQEYSKHPRLGLTACVHLHAASCWESSFLISQRIEQSASPTLSSNTVVVGSICLRVQPCVPADITLTAYTYERILAESTNADTDRHAVGCTYWLC